MEKERAKVINFILYFIAILLFLILIIYLLFIENIPDCKEDYSDFKNKSDSYLLNVNGSSMLPLIGGDAQCACSKQDNYTIDDIVVFSFVSNNSMFTVMHKIISVVNSTEVITKGDLNNSADSFLVPQKSIICAVENRHRIQFGQV